MRLEILKDGSFLMNNRIQSDVIPKGRLVQVPSEEQLVLASPFSGASYKSPYQRNEPLEERAPVQVASVAPSSQGGG